ncbi:MAG: NAD(P)-dependent oxidoreductase [Pseudomonadota bacterium]
MGIKVGFIGLGLMGGPMVKRLLAAQFDVAIWNRSTEKMAAFNEYGARSCQSIRDLVEQSDAILLCVSDTQAVEAVVFDSDGVAEAGAPGKVIIDFSSIDPMRTREMASELKNICGMDWIDAPVSGGTAGAENGSLIIMAGGDATVLDAVRSIFLPLGERLTHMGPVGAGQMTKLCNQMVVANNAVVIAEMMALGRKAGVDVDKLADALAGGFADSKPLQILAPQMAARDFTLKWKVATLQKDLEGAINLAQVLEMNVPMTLQGNQLLSRHIEGGAAQLDLSTVINLYEEHEK